MQERNIFATESGDGQYGTEALEAVVATANSFYDGYQRVYADDGRIDVNDVPDLFIIGPSLYGALDKSIRTAKNLGKEVTDLSEAEKLRLSGLAGERINDPSYLKVVNGLLDVIDGIAEKLNPSNPVD